MVRRVARHADPGHLRDPDPTDSVLPQPPEPDDARRSAHGRRRRGLPPCSPFAAAWASRRSQPPSSSRSPGWSSCTSSWSRSESAASSSVCPDHTTPNGPTACATGAASSGSPHAGPARVHSIISGHAFRVLGPQSEVTTAARDLRPCRPSPTSATLAREPMRILARLRATAPGGTMRRAHPSTRGRD